MTPFVFFFDHAILRFRLIDVESRFSKKDTVSRKVYGFFFFHGFSPNVLGSFFAISVYFLKPSFFWRQIAQNQTKYSKTLLILWMFAFWFIILSTTTERFSSMHRNEFK